LLLQQKAKDLNIKVDSEVAKYLAGLQKESKIADPEKFQEYVREQTGMTYEDYRADIMNGMLTQRVIRQEVGGKMNIKKGELQATLENAVWSQPKGYVTDPIKIENGFLILKVEDHQKEGQADLSEVENEIMDKLYAPRMQPAVREFLTKLRQDAFLEIK